MIRAPTTDAVAPAMAPVFSCPEKSATMSTYLEDYKAIDQTTKATIGSMIYFLAKLVVESPTEEPAVNAAKLFATGAAKKIHDLCSVVITDASNEEESLILLIQTNVSTAPKWLMDLINRSHKKPLDHDNVAGYLAMLNHKGTKPIPVANMINNISPFFPDSVSVPDFRKQLTKGKWTNYAVTRVSAGKILIKIANDLIALGVFDHDDEVHKAIKESAAAPWDLDLAESIPERVKAFGSIFLQAAGTPIDEWYQGNKAVDEMPASRVKRAKEIMRRYLEIKSEVSNLETLRSVDEFSTFSGFFS